LAPPKKLHWQEEPLNVKEKSFPSPFVKQTAITQPYMVLFKICKRHLVQHMILIQLVYKRSHGHKWLTTGRKTQLDLDEEGDDSLLYHN